MKTTTRQKAMQWWNDLSDLKKAHTMLRNENHFTKGRNINTLTGREIEQLWKQEIKSRLEYLRGEIRAERISTGEILELNNLKEHIEPGDVELLQWVVDEFPNQ